ncbi:MAG TPA: hypothetical protein VK956_13540 [Verrucomicrobium sp.]|nr:hypothetical protein [Verrucomicrobium sp.]
MPLASLVCPHCEHPVEVNVTNVTRSRECPSCRRVIMLQFTTRSSRVKHKALLTELTELAGSTPAMVVAGAGMNGNVMAMTDSAVPETPRVLEGSIRNRMGHDPEVKSSARTLVWGLGLVVFFLAIAVLGKTLHWWEDAARGLQNLQTAYLASRSTGVQDDATSASTPAKVAPRPLIAKASEWDSEQDAALKMVKSFLNAKDVETRLKMVRDPGTVEKSLRDYYAQHPAGPIAFSRVVLEEAHPLGVHSYRFAVTLDSGEVRSMLALRPEMGSPYVVDWGSGVVYSEMAWYKYLADRPAQPVMFRLLAVQDEHYNYHFLDSRRLLCLRLTNPLDAKAPPIYGYCARTSTVGRTLDFVTRKNLGEPARIIVKLKYPGAGESSDGNQVWIDEIITEGWTARGY